MTITALTGLAPEWYTPPQHGDGEQTAFELRPLNGLEYATIQAMISSAADDAAAVVMTESRIRYVIERGLVGWRNFNDGNGAPLTFMRERINRIDSATLADLVNEIMTRSQLNDAQKKT